jgi:hypothetical protein
MTGPALCSFIINANSGNIQERKKTRIKPENKMSNILFKTALKIFLRGFFVFLFFNLYNVLLVAANSWLN